MECTAHPCVQMCAHTYPGDSNVRAQCLQVTPRLTVAQINLQHCTGRLHKAKAQLVQVFAQVEARNADVSEAVWFAAKAWSS